MKAVEWFLDGLRRNGVEWIAALCGHGLDPLFHAARRAGVRLIDTRNEQTAAYIAECYGRLTRRPGVCAVSSGVAVANALTGVVNAWFDGAPMLLISGSAARTTAGLGHFQDLDQTALAAPVTAYSRTIDCPERVLQLLEDALRAAVWPRPAPVHLMFPMDVQNTEVPGGSLVRPRPAHAAVPSNGDVAALARAERPLIIAGSGAYYAGEADALVQFSEQFSIPLVTPIWDRGPVDRRPSATFLGVIGAASGGPRLLADADSILMAGAQPDYRTGYLQPPAVAESATIVWAASGWDELQADYEQHGGRVHTAWLAEASRRRDDFARTIALAAARDSSRGMHAVHIIQALREVMPEDACLLIDGGSIGQWVHQSLTPGLLGARYPGHWLTCGRSGVVGWGLGGAMAARLAFPDRPIILLSGDGAFTFTVAEIECAVRQRLHFVAIVADDEAWGITHAGHLRQFGEGISTKLGPIAFDRLAESLGARGVAITSPDQIKIELQRALSEPAVTVLHVPVVGGNPGA